MKIQRLASIGLVCLVTVLMVCADAQAQRGGGRGPGGGGGFGRGGFGFGGPLALVQREDVQEELSLTSAQQKDIEALQDELRPDREGFGNFREMSDAEREEAFARMREEGEKRQEQARAKLKDILKADQAKRLAELELQFAVRRLENDDQLGVLTAYIDQEKLQAAMGEPFEFEERGFGGGPGRGGRRDRGEDGARERGASDDAETGGRRGRRGN